MTKYQATKENYAGDRVPCDYPARDTRLEAEDDIAWMEKYIDRADRLILEIEEVTE